MRNALSRRALRGKGRGGPRDLSYQPNYPASLVFGANRRVGAPKWVVADLDEDYIARMEDVLATYERPYDPQEPVVCLDEMPVSLHADVRAGSAVQPGREARRDNEYERCGTANVFCAVEPKAGRHFTFSTPDRSGFEFAHVAARLALAYPAARRFTW